PPTNPEIDVGLFFPSRLMEGGVLTARLEVPWVNGRDAILRSRNKAETLARLDAAGIPVPDIVFVSNPIEKTALTTAFERFDTPALVKPNSTSRGQGVLTVADRNSLFGVTDYIDLLHQFPGMRDRSYLIQEFMPAARDLRVMVIDGRVLGAVERSVPDAEVEAGRWKRNVHLGANATAIDPDDTVRTLAEDTAAVLDIPILGVDILQTDSRTVVLETNARPTVDAKTKYEDQFYDVFAKTIRTTVNR
ncbi:MAG: ATP-grasp domain-containing protein, partial [Halodesulfurarchaeum sp.]